MILPTVPVAAAKAVQQLAMLLTTDFAPPGLSNVVLVANELFKIQQRSVVEKLAGLLSQKRLWFESCFFASRFSVKPISLGFSTQLRRHRTLKGRKTFS